MLARRILRLSILLVGGVTLVWLFGVDHGESLLSGAKKRQGAATNEVAKAESRADTPNVEKEILVTENADSQMALRDAHIPVRESLKDRPDVKVKKYEITIGRSETGLSRRILADDVTVEIFNKKIDPESKRLARVQGKRAEIEFRDVPDPKSFRDAMLLGMTLSQQVVVEYLNDSGKTIAKLECESLHLGDAEIKGPGPCTITMEGLTITGTDLTLDRSNGSLRLERDVMFRGTNFQLPSRSAVVESTPDPQENAAPPVERTIACSGPYTFVPSKQENEATTPQVGDDLSATIKGGVMTFRQNVLATEGDASKLTSDDLEVVLKSKDAETGEAKTTQPTESEAGSNLRISRFFARGSATMPARLVNAQGTFVAETLLLEQKESGQWITLQGQPKVIDAAFGGGEPGAEKSTSRFDASAARQLRIRPADLVAKSDPATAKDDRKFTVVELDGQAHLERKSENPDEAFGLDAERIELNVSSSRPEGATKAVTKLEDLIATGSAKGTLPQGTFLGDVIKLVPKQSAPGSDPQFEVDISPNPSVDLTMADETVKRRIHVTTPKNGRLLFTPSTSKDEAAVARFTGKTKIEIFENDAVGSTLDANEFISIRFQSQAAGGAIEDMHAKGQVVFNSPTQGFAGRADELTMTPKEGTKGTFDLLGNPAVATVTEKDQSQRTIRGRHIRIDPDRGTLRAEDSVSADLGDLAISQPNQAPTAKKTKPGNAVLHCQILEVAKDEATQATIVTANGAVVIDDTTNGLHAESQSLRYEETIGKIHLFGTIEDPAILTRRVASSTPNVEPTSVEIKGPDLSLDSKTSNLFCERNGSIRLIQPSAAGAGRSTVNASCVGPIRYGEDRLHLTEDVVFRFEEGGEEVRSLWSDRATISFIPEAERSKQDATAKSSAPGIEEMFAEGRVHLIQTAPRPLEAEGQSLSWKIVDGIGTMLLVGSSPKCWVKGLSENKNLRYEADSFSMKDGSQEFTADNGRFVYDPEVAPR